MSSPRRMDFSKYPRETVTKDDTLFLEDEQSKALYVLLTGSFGIFRNDVQVATVDEPLSIIGEISALTGRRRNATVKALKQSNVVVIAEPDELFEEYPQMGAKLARLLANRLAGMDTKFVEIKGQLSKLMVERHHRQTASTVILSQEQLASAAMGLEDDDDEDSTMELARAIASRDEGGEVEATASQADIPTETDLVTLPDPDEIETLDAEPEKPGSDPFAAAAAPVPAVGANPDPQSREYENEVFDVLTDILDWDPSIGT